MKFPYGAWFIKRCSAAETPPAAAPPISEGNRPPVFVNFHSLHARLLDSVRWRVENGELTVRRLARLMDVSQSHLQNILTGVRGLSTDKADRLLRVLDLSVLDLILEEPPPPVPIPWVKPKPRRGRKPR